MPAFKPFGLPDGVEPIPGEPLRFRVQSRTDPEMTYLVDLGEIGWNGCCGCQAFQMRFLPKLKEDRREGRPPVKRRCYHIRRALYYMAEVSVRLLANKTNKQ